MGPAPQATTQYIHPSSPKVTHPVLVLLSGLPGTGKSFFSRKLAEKLPGTILESDAIRKNLFPLPSYSPVESARVFRFIHQQAEELLRAGHSVIIDATNLTEKHRRSAYLVAENSQARLIIVQVDAPPKIVQQRLKNRVENPGIHDKSDADWAVYRKMKTAAEKIKRPYYYVDTTRDIAPVIDKIVREARN